MTYCVGIAVNEGLVFVSDSRTNAGVDNVSTYSKMRRYGVPGERQFVICTAGNLATTQGVIAQIERDMRANEDVNLMTVGSVAEAASYLGALNLEQQKKNTGGGPVFEASLLLGGEVAGAPRNLFRIYAEGNYIETSHQTPFLQVGESKYGKPILDRVLSENTPLERAALCGLVSMDATMRSNLTVGPPIEVSIYNTGSLAPCRYVVYDEDSEFLRELKINWNQQIKQAFDRLPPMVWNEGDKS
jgi:putative proteasome-type protease